MDPVYAVGLASAILSFVEFSWGLVSGTWEIHHTLDGITNENARLEDVMEDLGLLADALHSQVPVETQAEKNIARLAKDCQEDSKTLRGLLSSMKGTGKRRQVWKSLKASWRSILDKDEVAQLKSQLQGSRAEIQLNLITVLQ